MTTPDQWLNALTHVGAWVPPQAREAVTSVIIRIQADSAARPAPKVPEPMKVPHPPTEHPNDIRRVTALLAIQGTNAVIWSPAWHNGKRWFHRAGCRILKWVDNPPTEAEMREELESAWFGRKAKENGVEQ